jgi:hypothetical protein
MIFKKLDNVELLYSLLGISKTLDRVKFNPVFTKKIKILNHYWYRRIFPLVDILLDRFFAQVLPDIHYRINTLHLD